MTEPEGRAPLSCLDCKNPFPSRIVERGNQRLWAEICLACKRKRYHHTVGFPKRYERLSLLVCKVNSGNESAMEYARSWIAGEVKNLFLWGPPGTGKTHIASAAMYEGPIGVSKFVSVPTMLLQFQAAVKEHQEIKLLSVYEDPTANTMLFDDVGAHRISDFGIEMFGILLDRFYANDRSGLIFTSNLSPKQILETMGERISSRLCGLCQTVELKGADQRLE